MIAQQLVDGMDLDEQWCNRFVPSPTYRELDFALSLVGKKERPEMDWDPELIAILNGEQAQALDVSKTPGRDIPIQPQRKCVEKRKRMEARSMSAGSKPLLL